jgi:hypothetical protein
LSKRQRAEEIPVQNVPEISMNNENNSSMVPEFLMASQEKKQFTDFLKKRTIEERRKKRLKLKMQKTQKFDEVFDEVLDETENYHDNKENSYTEIETENRN